MKARLLFFSLFFTGCNFVGGAGKIKGYRYEVSKQTLKDAVDTVVSLYPDIRLDTSLNNESYMYLIELRLCVDTIEYQYNVGYVGYSAKQAELAIVSAWENNIGGDEGDNDFSGKEALRSRLIHVFDERIASKIDSVLGMKHTDEFN